LLLEFAILLLFSLTFNEILEKGSLK
jgi:hypothetical protein